jgi:hypothetical protein
MENVILCGNLHFFYKICWNWLFDALWTEYWWVLGWGEFVGIVGLLVRDRGAGEIGPQGRLDLAYLTWHTWLGILDLAYLTWHTWLGILDLAYLTWQTWLGRLDVLGLTKLACQLPLLVGGSSKFAHMILKN